MEHIIISAFPGICQQQKPTTEQRTRARIRQHFYALFQFLVMCGSELV